METAYHISPKDRLPRPCEATKRTCKYGAHYKTPEEAIIASYNDLIAEKLAPQTHETNTAKADNPLASKMKRFEAEQDALIRLPEGCQYYAIRLDGKNFSTYTRGLQKPFDLGFMEDMNTTTQYLAQNIQQVQAAYVQSDEISLIIRISQPADLKQLWYGGRVQKITSVAAGMASSKFATLRPEREGKLPSFDARVFTLPTNKDAQEYLTYRQLDGRKNAITMGAETILSHKQLAGMSTGERARALAEAGKPVEEFLPEGFLNGRIFTTEKRTEVVRYLDKRTKTYNTTKAVRNVWVQKPLISTKNSDREDYLETILPKQVEEARE